MFGSEQILESTLLKPDGDRSERHSFILAHFNGDRGLNALRLPACSVHTDDLRREEPSCELLEGLLLVLGVVVKLCSNGLEGVVGASDKRGHVNGALVLIALLFLLRLLLVLGEHLGFVAFLDLSL